MERIAEKAEAFAKKVEVQASQLAVVVEGEAVRLSSNFENHWEPILLIEKGGKKISTCPEVSYLGIETRTLSWEKAEKLGFKNKFGSYVAKVLENSAAQRAGIQPFDYLIGIDDQRTSDNQSFTDILEDFEVGEAVTIHLIRQGQPVAVPVKLEDFSWEGLSDVDDKGFLGVSPTDNEDSDDMDGASVEIVESSAAAEMGLKEGDIITGINGHEILDWEDIEIAIQGTKPGDKIHVEFVRDNQTMKAEGEVKSYRESDAENNDWNMGIDWQELGDVNEMLDGAFAWEQSDDRAFLGIYAETISESKAKKLGFDNPYGSYVTGIVGNTAAERAGIQPFDYIYGVDEYRVGKDQSLGGILHKFEPGDNATVHFIRNNDKKSAKLTFGKHSESKSAKRNSCEDPFLGVLMEASEEEGDENGVAINPVKPSTAHEMGLLEGDVITHINGYRILDWQDLTTAIEMMNPGETIAVSLNRDGKPMKLSKPIKSYAETKKCYDCDCGQTNITINDKSYSYSDDGNSYSFNFGNKAGNLRATSPKSAERMDISKAKIELQNLSGSEAGNVKVNGAPISGDNSLRVDNLKLSPNPSEGMLSLTFDLPSSGQTVVRVYNLNGRVLYEYDLGVFSGDFSDTVDISQNGPGNYFLVISQNGKLYSKKIVLSKS